MEKAVFLTDMTWPEVKARLPKMRLAILPTGSTEQHGPHLTFETDIVIATELARRLALEHYPHIVVAPPLPAGVSSHHMNFPGTITWRYDTFMACLEDTILALAEHGIQRFLILNGHGGNRAAISVLASQLRYEDDLMVAACTWFELVREACHKFIPKRRVHADEIEAAMGLYLAPRVVRKTALTKGTAHPDPYPYTDPGTGGGFECPTVGRNLHPTGRTGTPAGRRPQWGKNSPLNSSGARASSSLRSWSSDHRGAAVRETQGNHSMSTY